jgi:hypothetical protein
MRRSWSTSAGGSGDLLLPNQRHSSGATQHRVPTDRFAREIVGFLKSACAARSRLNADRSAAAYHAYPQFQGRLSAQPVLFLLGWYLALQERRALFNHL